MLDNLEADFPEHEPRPCNAPKALEGIRVVDFSHFIAGPFATMILADMGADVIKIEAPGRGDDLRRYPPMHPDLKHGAPFLWNNRNKRSVGIDLKSPEGLEIVRELIATADVVVENFSTGVAQRLGSTTTVAARSGRRSSIARSRPMGARARSRIGSDLIRSHRWRAASFP